MLFFVAICLFTGCGSRHDQNQDPSGQRQSAESLHDPEGHGNESGEIPKELEKMEKDLNEIIKALDGPVASSEDDKKEEEQKGQQEDTAEDKNKRDNEEKSSSDNGEKQEEKESEENNNEQQGKEKEENKKGSQAEDEGQQEKEADKQAQQPTQQSLWQKITPVVNRLHESWNSFEPKAAKNGGNHDKLSAFSSALNELTNSVFSKDENASLINANKCYGEITELYSIYKKPNISEVKKLNFYTRSAVLSSMNNDWDQADDNLDHLDTIWNLLKNNLGEDNKEQVDILDFSIMELKKVVQEKNKNLTNIKGRIVLTNIDEIDKKLEEETRQNQQQSSNK